MKFKIDENLPLEIAELLWTVGYDALTVIEQELRGEGDALIGVGRLVGATLLGVIGLLGTSDIARHYPEADHFYT